MYQYEQSKKLCIICDIYNNVLYRIVSTEPLVEFHIPQQVTKHQTWNMYNDKKELQALYAHPESEAYETFDGALYDKKRHGLLYVPLGKTSLHIPKYVQHIGYHTLNHYNLKTITLDSENPNFCLVDGYLYNNEMTKLYFVPCDQKTLYIQPSLAYIDSSVFLRKFDDIVIHPSNPFFKTVDGILFYENEIVYICPNARNVHLPAYISCSSLRKLNNAPNLTSVTISEKHPKLIEINNVIYSKDCTEIVYFPKYVQEVTLPDQLTSLKNENFNQNIDLRMISVSVNTSFSARSFAGLHENCRIFVRLNNPTSIELPRTSPMILANCIQFLKGADAEIKAGTEIFYLNYYLLGLNHTPKFLRTIHVSSWQMIKHVITNNCISHMKEMLSDGHLITRKNINKSQNLALECGSLEIYELLSSHDCC